MPNRIQYVLGSPAERRAQALRHGRDVLTRLVERFPTHENAAAAAVAAGTSYISAQNFVDAVDVLDRLVNNPELDAPLIKAEGLYWLGECYLRDDGIRTGSTGCRCPWTGGDRLYNLYCELPRVTVGSPFPWRT